MMILRQSAHTRRRRLGGREMPAADKTLRALVRRATRTRGDDFSRHAALFARNAITAFATPVHDACVIVGRATIAA